MKLPLAGALILIGNILMAQNDSTEDLPARPHPFLSKLSIGLEYGHINNHLLTNISSLPFTEYKPLAGYSIGIPLEYAMQDWFSIYLDPNVTTKNYEYARTNFFQGVFEKYINTYLQLPVMGKFSFGGTRLRGYVSTGMYGGYWIAAKVNGVIPNPLDPNMTSSNSNNPSTIFDELNPYAFNEKYSFDNVKDNRWEFGWILGLGIKYQLTKSIQLFGEGKTFQSLTDHQKHYMTNQVPQFNQTYGISAGLLLNLKSLLDKK